MTNIETPTETPEKREWVTPELQQLEAGAAESQAGGTPDGSGNQGS